MTSSNNSFFHFQNNYIDGNNTNTNQYGCFQKVSSDYNSYPLFNFQTALKKGKHYAIMFAGARHSGKTSILAEIWDILKEKFDLIVVFCMNPQAAIYKFFSEKDKRFVFTEFHANILNDISIIQKFFKNIMNVLYFFDDCSEENLKYNNALTQVGIRGRNMKCSLIFSTQDFKFLKPNLRANLDIILCLNLHTEERTENFIKNIVGGYLPCPDMFRGKKSMKLDWQKAWYDQVTHDHNALVIDFRNEDNKPVVLYRYRRGDNKYLL